ncbi:response regulator transcription factor [Agathobaculum sp.]|uniref:response regulator transcription factor n=1 Tax=Agathobaculum sp. TaxID=2048138 RepID=UPI002A835485|nr:response regulator [Agathobaculum sp.]MDY3617986.1 response regulator [Agathobaculum sp.]
MYRVLLADDEIHICQLIQYLVDWEALDLELIGTASSGVDAFEQAFAKRPDIIISDIRMSGFSGIDLLEKVRTLGLDCRFILISGYRQFEYAQKAIQYGVTDYIVKPIKKSELEASLRKAVADLEQLRGQNANAGTMPTEVLSPAPRHDKERLTADLQSGALPLSQATAECLREVYGIDLSEVCFVLCWHFVCHSEYSDETLRLLEGKVSSWLENQSSEWFAQSVLLRHEGRLFFVCTVPRLEDMPGFDLIRDGCQSVISIFSNWEAVLGAAQLQAGQALSMPISAAANAADVHLFDSEKAVHTESPAERNVDDFHEAVGYDACSHLVSAMQILDADAVRIDLTAAFAALIAHPALTASAVYGYCSWVIGEMNHALSAFDTGSEAASRYLDRAALEHELHHIAPAGRLGRRLTSVLTERIHAVRDAVRLAENRPIRQTKEIVARRYMEPISLNEVAAEVDLNPVYLSVLFKKETGTNFKDYVINVRMDIAKSLLRDGESLLTVSEKVGYKDAKYFSKLFTRIVGVNPTQYKKLYN